MPDCRRTRILWSATADGRHEGMSGRRVIDDKKPSRVRKCLLCGHKDISATGEGRFVTTSCSQCGAVLKIEFNPPDEPEVRARIERIDDAP